MDIWTSVEIGSFLRDRKERIKPAQANKLGMRRLEKIDFLGNIHIVDGKDTNTDMIVVKNGDLVISGINVEKGALAVYEGSEDILATIHYSAYEFDSSQIDIEYLKWFLKSNVFLDILKKQTGGGIKTELKPKRFLPLKILLPNLEIQKDISQKILSVSDEIYELKRLNSDNNKTFSLLRQSILQEAIQGKLVSQDPNDEPAGELLNKIREEKERLIKDKKIKKEKPMSPITEDEIPYGLPKGWEWVRLGDVCLQITDGTHQTPHYVDKGMMFLSAQNIKPYRFMPDQHKYVSNEDYLVYTRNTKPELNDILLTRVGAGIGEAAVIDKELDFALYVSLCLIKPIHKFVFSQYLLHWINSPEGTNKAISNTYGRGTSQGNLNLVLIKNFVIPLPPLKEQKFIVTKIDQLMQLCDELEASITKAQADSELLMQAVLQEAFSGN